MARSGQTVDEYLAQFDHPLKPEVVGLRAAILDAHPDLGEHIKWNAPSFVHDGEDRVTFRFPPKGGAQLILHRGAKVKDSAGFAFEDDTGLLRWLAPDRAVISLDDVGSTGGHQEAIVGIVGRWLEA